jgi:heme exporter protein A
VRLLALRGVACLRGGRLLFEGLDLVLGPGGAALVKGPNGVGKSSLIRLAAGLLRAAAGTVERAEAALADEHLALDERQPLGRALAFWTADAAPGIAAMGLEGLTDVPVRMLSTGQRKRAALARVVASGAPLWLLDEPGNGLDADGLARLEAAMAAHRAAGGAILAATHQPLVLPGVLELTLACAA